MIYFEKIKSTLSQFPALSQFHRLIMKQVKAVKAIKILPKYVFISGYAALMVCVLISIGILLAPETPERIVAPQTANLVKAPNFEFTDFSEEYYNLVETAPVKKSVIRIEDKDYMDYPYMSGFLKSTAKLETDVKDLPKAEIILKIAAVQKPYVKDVKKIKQEDKAWRKHALKVSPKAFGKIQIAVVMDDLGIRKANTMSLIEMEEPLTLSFLPYATGIREFAVLAKEKNHEIMLHIPMEPKGDADPGPNALLTKVSVDKQYKRLYWNLSKLDNFVGFNNHMGSEFTEDKTAVARILEVAKSKGMMVLDSKTSSKSVMILEANRLNIPHATRDVFLDNVPKEAVIWQQFMRLEKLAKKHGQAVAIGHPYKATIAALRKWLPTLEAKGIEIVPISYLAAKAYEKKQLALKGSIYVAAELSPTSFHNQQGTHQQAAFAAY